MGKMHADEVDIDISLVARLLAGQFPQWAHLPLAPVHTARTDNAIYRLSDDLAVRLPALPGPPSKWTQNSGGCPDFPRTCPWPSRSRWH